MKNISKIPRSPRIPNNPNTNSPPNNVRPNANPNPRPTNTHYDKPNFRGRQNKSRKPNVNADPSLVAQPASSTGLSTDSSIILSPLERAKSLVFSRISASLISISAMDEEEAQEKSLVPFVLHPAWHGRPIVAMEEDEVHCQNLLQETKCAMTFLSLTPSRVDYSKLPLPRVSSLGDVALIEDPKAVRKILKLYSQVHPGSSEYLTQCKFFEFKPDDIHYVDSCGEYLHFTAKEYEKCPVDPLARYTKSVIDTVTQSRQGLVQDLIQLCARCAEEPMNITDAFILSVDRLGFNLLACEEREGEEAAWVEIRLPFGRPVREVPEYLAELNRILESEE